LQDTVANDELLGTESLSFIVSEIWVIVGSLAPSRACPPVAGLVRSFYLQKVKVRDGSFFVEGL
jgi:hypothetical protein